MIKLFWKVIDKRDRHSIDSCNSEHKKAFTLAEVLITLSIIGVIASMTIPSLVQDVQEAQWKSGYKKAFASASQAWIMARNEKLLMTRSSQDDGDINKVNFNIFKSKFTIIKDCNSNNNSECWNPNEYWRSNTPVSDAPAFIDNSGIAWSMRGYWPIGSGMVSNLIFLDVNNLKGPNKYGKDRFVLVMTNNNPNLTDIYSIFNLGTGYPITLRPYPDTISNTDDTCPSGNCYYTSWLKE